MITSFNIGGNSGGGSSKDIEELKGRVNTLEGEYISLDTNKADADSVYIKEEVYTKEEVDDLIPDVPTKTSELTNDSGFLTEHQSIKTINGETITGTGNVTIKGSDANVSVISSYPKLTNDEIAYNIQHNVNMYYMKSTKAMNTINIYNSTGAIIGVIAPHWTSTDFVQIGILPAANELSQFSINGTVYQRSADGPVVVQVYENQSIKWTLSGDDNNCTIEHTDEENNRGYLYSKDSEPKISVTATQGSLSVELAKKSDIESTNEKIAEKADITEFVSLRDRVEEIELFSTPNVTIVGNPTIKSGQVSGFNVNNYLKFPYLVHLHDKTFSIHFCITTSDDITNQQNILDSEYGLAIAIRNGRFVLAMGSDGSTWDMGEHIGTHTIEANTTYHVKLSWDKSTYKLEFGDTMDDSGDVVYTLDIVVNDTKSLAAKEMFIGVGSDLTHIFGGSLNLNHCYLIMDGKVVWNGINGNLSTDLSNIDEDGKDVVKALAKQAQIVWYGTQEQYDALEDKTQFNIYLISE